MFLGVMGQKPFRSHRCGSHGCITELHDGSSAAHADDERVGKRMRGKKQAPLIAAIETSNEGRTIADSTVSGQDV